MYPPDQVFYRHSGKFGVHGPILALVAGVVVGLPVGYVYAYLIKWIPFIYFNVFITAGYGFLFGFVTGVLMKFGKVRNNLVALGSALCVGVLAVYFAWNAHVHTLGDDLPWVFTPGQIVRVMQVLYEKGSWGLLGSGAITGIPLAVVWLVEAGMIVGLSTLAGYALVASTPYCDQHECWLDQEKTIDKLDAFTHPAHVAALQAGDLSPLDQAKPRVPASGQFGRLTLRHSDKCHDFCTLSIANVTVTLNKEGKPEEKAQELVSNVMVPKEKFDYLAGFEHATAKVT